MTSFAAAIEPAAQPRLAAVVFLVHVLAAAGPWLARSAPVLAVALSMLAIAGFVSTLARVPGPHCRLAAIAIDGRGCRARLAGQHAFVQAELSDGARAYASLVSLEVAVAGRRLGWLLPRGTLPPDDFRRLKARIRLSC